MKKICVIGAALALFTTTGANAQVVATPLADQIIDKDQRALHFGVEGGVTLNNLYHLQEDFQTSNMLKVGGHAGFLLNFGSGRWAVQPGLRYIMKGAEIEDSYQDALWHIETKHKLTFNYIELPLNIVWSSGNWGAGRFMVGFGGYAAYMFNAEEKFKVKTKSMLEGAPPETTVEGKRTLSRGNPDDHDVRSYDAGLGGFIGYQFTGGVYLKAGGEWSLVDLQKNVALGNFYERNYNFLFSVGYMFGYKCK
jgi:hypothetical protein